MTAPSEESEPEQLQPILDESKSEAEPNNDPLDSDGDEKGESESKYAKPISMVKQRSSLNVAEHSSPKTENDDVNKYKPKEAENRQESQWINSGCVFCVLLVIAIIAFCVALFFSYKGVRQCEQTLQSSIDTTKQFLNGNKTNLLSLTQEWIDVERKSAVEDYKSVTFEEERKMDDVKILVALGMTGSGKSTFLNRLANDKSEKGDTGPFRVGHTLRSETSKISKSLLKNYNGSGMNLVLVDTPGASDSNNRDIQFAWDLKEYLYGSGGVNLFCIFYDLASKRFSSTLQELLKEYQDVLGAQFWQHSVVIATKADFIEQSDIHYLKNQIHYELFDKVIGNKLDRNEIKLPIIAVGQRSVSYTQAVEMVIKIINQTERYDCQSHFKSDLMLLHLEARDKEQQWHTLLNRIQDLSLYLSNLHDQKTNCNTSNQTWKRVKFLFNL